MTGTDIEITIGPDEAGMRLDRIVSRHLAECSRRTTGEMIRSGRVRVNGALKKPGYRLRNNDRITGIPIRGGTCIPPRPYPESAETDDFGSPAAGPFGPGKPIAPEPMDIDILYEDAALLVVNKPPGLVVHPAPGHPDGTLANGLLYHFPGIECAGPAGRPGIVHRIDKDTSGLLLVAKTPASHERLSCLFQSRKIRKTYLALVYGNPSKTSGEISKPISRHQKDRKKMAISREPGIGRDAYTSWRVLERYGGITLLQITILTGRTHQIRVHCNAMGHPLVGDATYGYKKPQRAFAIKPEWISLLTAARRQMLHSSAISLAHPETGMKMTFESPPADDMALLIRELNKS